MCVDVGDVMCDELCDVIVVVFDGDVFGCDVM